MDSRDRRPQLLESLLYDNMGSFLWETGGRPRTHPSMTRCQRHWRSFFGEVLFRMASLVLEGDGDGGKPGSGASWVQR